MSNPEKIYFPKAGITKLELVQYYLAVAEGALRGVARRPMILKRYVNGVEAEPFYQKRVAEKRPAWVEIATFTFPSGRQRRRDRREQPRAARVRREPRLRGSQPARDPRRGHGSAPTSCASISIRCRASPWSQIVEVARRRARGARRVRASSAGRRRAARAACTSGCGSRRTGRSRSCAGRRSRSRARSSGARRRSRPRSGGRRSATACSSTTTRTRAIARRRARTRCAPTPGRARVDAAVVGRLLRGEPARLHAAHRAGDVRGARRRARRDRRCGRIARARCSRSRIGKARWRSRRRRRRRRRAQRRRRSCR